MLFFTSHSSRSTPLMPEPGTLGKPVVTSREHGKSIAPVAAPVPTCSGLKV
jgi:hypothetical protein